mmetsp:Transcript_50531/g.107294  ORF Transcript_50531/g.107294 Transcript_50531/m.107294 type:complete len:138 (-) Transcript_50531:453-866(-)
MSFKRSSVRLMKRVIFLASQLCSLVSLAKSTHFAAPLSFRAPFTNSSSSMPDIGTVELKRLKVGLDAGVQQMILEFPESNVAGTVVVDFCEEFFQPLHVHFALLQHMLRDQLRIVGGGINSILTEHARQDIQYCQLS